LEVTDLWDLLRSEEDVGFCQEKGLEKGAGNLMLNQHPIGERCWQFDVESTASFLYNHSFYTRADSQVNFYQIVLS
jgi:hypothetical protein